MFNTKIIRLNSKMFPKEVLISLDDVLSENILHKFNFKKFTEIKNNPTSI